MNSPPQLEEDTIYIVCAADKAFLPYCSAMLFSLSKNSKSDKYFVYIMLEESVDTELINQFSKFLSPLMAYEVVKVPDKEIEPYLLPYTSALPKAAYYRLLMQNFLPKYLEKVLYLDGDIYVNGSLKSLWEIDLNKYVVGAVSINYINPGHKKNLELLDELYFNSGVMLVNLNKWRDGKIGEQTLNWLSENGHVVKFADQDGLNVILKNKWYEIPVVFNVTTTLLDQFQNNVDGFVSTYGVPKVIHFTGRLKPWNYLSIHPFKAQYLKCVEATPWPKARCVDLTFRNVLRRYIPMRLKYYLRGMALYR